MIIHQIWLSDDIPSHIQEWMKTWQNTGNEYVLWRYKDVAHWMSIIHEAKLTSCPPALQADLLRLLIIREYGGLYVDCDCKRVGSIPQLPINATGRWCGGADPFLLHGEIGDVAITNMIDYGWKQWEGTPPVYRWGYRAFHRNWKWNILDVETWCEHISQCSWGYYQHPRVSVHIPEGKSLFFTAG